MTLLFERQVNEVMADSDRVTPWPHILQGLRLLVDGVRAEPFHVDTVHEETAQDASASQSEPEQKFYDQC